MNLWLKGVKPYSKQHGVGMGRGRIYPKPAYSKWKSDLGWLIKKQWREKPYAGAVRLEVDISWRSPLGDAENLVGSIQDALQGIVYYNDCQIKRLVVTLHLVSTINECGIQILCDSIEDVDGWVVTAMRNARHTLHGLGLGLHTPKIKRTREKP